MNNTKTLDSLLGVRTTSLRKKVKENRRLEEALKFKFDTIPTVLYDGLTEYVVGQTDALEDVANAVCYHYTSLGNSNKLKGNMLLIGPTGCGKTYVVEKVAEILKVPLLIADITKYSGTGYVGDKVENLVQDLLDRAKGDLSSASRGIIYIDEIDKIAARDVIGRDVSGRDVQNNLLKIVEGEDVKVSFRKAPAVVSTKNILFIAGGAFSDLYKDLRRDKTITGFSPGNQRDFNDGEALYNARPEELISALVKYGMIPELLGRLPVISRFRQLDKSDLINILKNSKESPVEAYRESFGTYGIKVDFAEDAYDKIAELAQKRGIGSRGLKAVMEASLKPFKFYLPGSGIREIKFSSEAILKPEETALALLEEQQTKLQGGK